MPRRAQNYELDLLTQNPCFVNRFLQISASPFLVLDEKSSTFASSFRENDFGKLTTKNICLTIKNFHYDSKRNFEVS